MLYLKREKSGDRMETGSLKSKIVPLYGTPEYLHFENQSIPSI
jgi:hypothetical protein